MDEKTRAFLAGSPLARSLRLPARIVLQRTKLTAQELAAIPRAESYGPVPEAERACELEVGGQVLARGRIVKRRGAYWFRVRETKEVAP